MSLLREINFDVEHSNFLLNFLEIVGCTVGLLIVPSLFPDMVNEICEINGEEKSRAKKIANEGIDL